MPRSVAETSGANENRKALREIVDIVALVSVGFLEGISRTCLRKFGVLFPS